MDGDGDGYQSSTEYAEFLRQSIYEETGALVKISVGGTVNTIIDLSTSFSQAVTASRMAETIESRGDVHSYKEFVLIKMLEDLPKYKLNEYLEILMDSGAREIFADPEMVATAEEFLENSLNVSETARKLYLHRNTLIYRLDKIERATGLNIRKFSDSVTFRLITMLSKIVR
jgi:carbohydrate diacid regulator